MSGKLPEHIDDLEGFYKKNLENLELPPSQDLWSRIDNALPAAKPISPKIGNVANTYVWAAASVVVGAVSVYLVYNAVQKDKPLPPKVPSIEKVIKPSSVNEENDKARDKPTDPEIQIDKQQALPKSSPAEDQKSLMHPQSSSQDSSSINQDHTVVPIQEHVPVVPQDSILNQNNTEQKGDVPPKTLYEKLKAKNKNKSNDLFIKKKKE